MKDGQRHANYMDRLYKFSKYKGYKNRTVPKLHGNETIVNTELDVSYTFNEYGFRTKSWEDNKEECYVALGCSNTLGMGMPEELRWSNLLETHTGVTVYNLGIGHGSADTVTRLATGWLHEIKPTKVFVLWPPLVRWEIATKNKIITISPTTLKERNFTEEQNKIHYASMDEEFNFEVNSLRNKHTLKVICDNLNIELHTLDFKSCRGIDNRNARDGKHNGPLYQQALADEFINLLDK